MEKIASLLILPQENQLSKNSESKPTAMARPEIAAPPSMNGLMAALQKIRLAKGLPVKDFEDIEIDAAAMAETFTRAKIDAPLWPELVEQAWADHRDVNVPFGSPQVLSRFEQVARDRAMRLQAAANEPGRRLYYSIADCAANNGHVDEKFIESDSKILAGFFECQTCGRTRPKLRKAK